MVYSIKNTRNTEIDTVSDNTLKTTDFGIRIPGKNFSGYGEAIGQSLTHILESFACPNNGSDLPNPSNPAVSLTSPVEGQLWFDTTNAKLRVYNGADWIITAGSATPGPTPPTAITGDLWYNDSTDQLFAYDGASWVLIGPASPAADSVFTRAIKINSGGTGGAGSGDGTAPTGGANTDGYAMFIGNVLTGIWSDVQVLTTTYYYIELNDGSGNVRYYSFTPYDGQLEIGLNIESGASDYFNGRAKIADTADGIAGISSTELMRNDNGAGASDSRLPSVASLDIGDVSNRWDTIWATTFDGTATAAQYADIAERYEADAVYAAGTVVKLGGDKEITATTNAADTDVFGVVSANPAFMMNSKAGSNDTHPFIAFSGRLVVKLIGSVSKGQRIVSSENAGVARAATPEEATNCFAVIGRALADKTDEGLGTIEIVVGAK